MLGKNTFWNFCQKRMGLKICWIEEFLTIIWAMFFQTSLTVSPLHREVLLHMEQLCNLSFSALR